MKTNVLDIQKAKSDKRVLTWLTCYDYSFARALNDTEIDLILVGDSGGMVTLGYPDTIPVSMEEMLFMCSAVRRGAPDKFIVGDMPKGSYEASDNLAVTNAMRFVKESGADAIKLEGGSRILDRVASIVRSGIPVIGHIGLTPQSASSLGGYRVTGKSDSELKDLITDAKALEGAGVFALLLEAMPSSSAEKITSNLKIPVFGIGAGPKVDGQLLILHDLLGLYPNFRPKFAKNFIPEILTDFSDYLSNFHDVVKLGRETRLDGLFHLSQLAVAKFIEECKMRKFPSEPFLYNEAKDT